MDKAFWHSIVANDYAIPSEPSLASMTAELLQYLGSTDSELRDELAYPILERWIDTGCYGSDELRSMARQLAHNLTVGLGAQESDTGFLRAFSILTLVDIVYADIEHPYLDEGQLKELLDKAISYFLAEKDLRGYVPVKEWLHAIAHTADFFFISAQHSSVSAADLERIMEAIAQKISAPVAHVYLYDEDERLVRTVMSILQRNLLTMPFLTTWLDRFIHPVGGTPLNTNDWDEMLNIVRSEAQTCARHNIKHFLRSLYFQLLSPGFAGMTFITEKPPLTDELLPRVEATLREIRAWS